MSNDDCQTTTFQARLPGPRPGPAGVQGLAPPCRRCRARPAPKRGDRCHLTPSGFTSLLFLFGCQSLKALFLPKNGVLVSAEAVHRCTDAPSTTRLVAAVIFIPEQHVVAANTCRNCRLRGTPSSLALCLCERLFTAEPPLPCVGLPGFTSHACIRHLVLCGLTIWQTQWRARSCPGASRTVVAGPAFL